RRRQLAQPPSPRPPAACAPAFLADPRADGGARRPVETGDRGRPRGVVPARFGSRREALRAGSRGHAGAPDEIGARALGGGRGPELATAAISRGETPGKRNLALKVNGPPMPGARGRRAGPVGNWNMKT